MFTLPIGALFAIFGLVKRSDAKTIALQTPSESKEESVDQRPIADQTKPIQQSPSGSQILLIVIAVFFGVNICFGAISSFLNVGLHPSWAIFGVLQLLAGGGIIFWGIRRLKK